MAPSGHYYLCEQIVTQLPLSAIAGGGPVIIMTTKATALNLRMALHSSLGPGVTVTVSDNDWSRSLFPYPRKQTFPNAVSRFALCLFCCRSRRSEE